MKLILIRHGESARNRGYEVTDEENNLTTEGVKQVIKVGEDLVGKKIDAIYCSQTPRCEQTMDEILRNRDDEIPIHFSSFLRPKMKKEKFEKVKSRVEIFLDDLKYDHEFNETVVVISHQILIRLMNFQLTGKDIKVENGATIELELGKKKI